METGFDVDRAFARMVTDMKRAIRQGYRRGGNAIWREVVAKKKKGEPPSSPNQHPSEAKMMNRHILPQHDTQDHNPEPRYVYPLRREGLLDYTFKIDANLLANLLGEDDYQRLRTCHFDQTVQAALADAFAEYLAPIILHCIDRDDERLGGVA